MLTRRISIAAPIILAVYVLQESVVNQFHFPGGGFSLFLIFSLIWAVLSTPEIAALCGFFAGLLMDFSQSSGGPIGQWTLIMIAACYAISYFGSGNDSFASNPLGVTFLVAFVVFLVELAYVASGALLGVQTGEISQTAITLIGMSLWTLAVTPFSLPVFSRLHALAFDKRSAI